MTRIKSLGGLEQVVLFALLRLGSEAYGVAVRREIKRRTGRSITPGTIYPTLDRLERKGLVGSWVGDPTPERGGRAKHFYSLTPAGLDAVRKAWHEVTALAEGYEAFLEAE